MADFDGKQERFSSEVIAAASLAILKEEGPKALSLRRVGNVLGTSYVTVFRRCGSFDGLLDACADYVAADFPLITNEEDWRIATQLRFEAAYDMWAANTELIVLRHGRAWLGLNMATRFYEPAMRTIVDAGFSYAQAGSLFSALYWLTMGSVMATRANQWTPWESTESLEQLGADRFPALATVQRTAEHVGSRAALSEGLSWLIGQADPNDPWTALTGQHPSV
ncbi:MAG TPA: TetR/AcrR family transcriptional regulator C-terminal domain-containing protein [Solirubrobacteraceae bacterium]|nr:TetR/AcrR family transcriptional regulator C-terminal domain-containing protein [Solirubrobacteraceae bacterium]